MPTTCTDHDKLIASEGSPQEFNACFVFPRSEEHCTEPPIPMSNANCEGTFTGIGVLSGLYERMWSNTYQSYDLRMSSGKGMRSWWTPFRLSFLPKHTSYANNTAAAESAMCAFLASYVVTLRKE
jgi:hypothetical protein